MKNFRTIRLFVSALFLIHAAPAVLPVQAEEQVIVTYAGQSESAGDMWVGIEKGLFRKYGLDVRMLQVRNGPLVMATLATGDVKAIFPAASSALSATSGGLKISCVASAQNKLPRELMARKEIKSLDDLRGRTFGVQSIGGGLWLQTMIVLESLGVDPEKYQLKMRVIGDIPTVTQALMSENIDAAVLPYSFADIAKRAGYRSLADTATLKFGYQGNVLCVSRELAANAPDLVTRIIKGVIEAVVLIHSPSHKQEVMEILRKNLRLPKAEDAEASYKVLTSMMSLDVAPNFEAWRSIQKIVSRVNPKVGQVDLNQVLDASFVRRIEESGFLPEMRKKF